LDGFSDWMSFDLDFYFTNHLLMMKSDLEDDCFNSLLYKS